MKSTRKVSPIKYREVLSTISRLCTLADPDEKNPAITDIYAISHAFAGECGNPHDDWKEKYDEIRKALDKAKI
jgi:hypothetical protein